MSCVQHGHRPVGLFCLDWQLVLCTNRFPAQSMNENTKSFFYLSRSFISFSRAEYGDYENGESAAESGAQLGFVNDYIWHSHIPLRGRLLSEPGLNSATMLVDHEQTFSRMSAGIEAALDRVRVLT